MSELAGEREILAAGTRLGKPPRLGKFQKHRSFMP